jgi:hypothetical protein
MVNVEPKITSVLETAAREAATKINEIQEHSYTQLLKNEFENPPAPVTPQGTLDHKFLALIKQVVVWSDPEKTIPDYEKSLQLRALAYEGYERQKSGRPLPPRPVTEVEIASEIRDRIQRAKSGSEIVMNRHVHN